MLQSDLLPILYVCEGHLAKIQKGCTLVSYSCGGICGQSGKSWTRETGYAQDMHRYAGAVMRVSLLRGMVCLDREAVQSIHSPPHFSLIRPSFPFDSLRVDGELANTNEGATMGIPINKGYMKSRNGRLKSRFTIRGLP